MTNISRGQPPKREVRFANPLQQVRTFDANQAPDVSGARVALSQQPTKGVLKSAPPPPTWAATLAQLRGSIATTVPSALGWDGSSSRASSLTGPLLGLAHLLGHTGAAKGVAATLSRWRDAVAGLQGSAPPVPGLTSPFAGIGE